MFMPRKWDFVRVGICMHTCDVWPVCRGKERRGNRVLEEGLSLPTLGLFGFFFPNELIFVIVFFFNQRKMFKE